MERPDLHDYVEVRATGKRGTVVDASLAAGIYVVEVSDTKGRLLDVVDCRGDDLRVLWSIRTNDALSSPAPA